MRLKTFHVRMFRNVIDSGPIAVTDVTCFVGKNEAGKSTILEALHHLNPAKPIAKLNLLDQYPRWLKKEHEMSGEIGSAVPISATFALDKDEVTRLEKRFGAGTIGEEVVASRKYGEELSIEVALRPDLFVRTFVDTHVDAILQPRLATAQTSRELLEVLKTVAQEMEGEEATPSAQAAKGSLARLKEMLGGAASFTDAAKLDLRPRIPRTFYFSNYSQLRGRYTLEEVLDAVSNGSDDEEVQAAADFLALAQVSIEKIREWDFEECNAELEGVSSLLTRRVKTNWKQNQHLKLSVKIETVPAQHNRTEPRRYLQFRVEDTRHDFSNKLDRRSTGFRWFVSFMASFFEFERDKNLLLLLDEPGLSLHARAQKDLLDVIENKLAEARQVMYTTHSPFMVRTKSLPNVRVVEDRGPDRGSVTTNDAGTTTDPDTLFPLQAALGYDIAQNLFIGDKNVLVEGVSDFIYLTVFSTHLESLGRRSLPTDCRLLPCRGATNIATFVALLGEQLDVVVLLDGDAPSQRIDNAIAAKRLSESRVLRIDDHTKPKGADIEDLFEPKEYLDLFNECFGASLTLANLKGKDRIVKRIARATGNEFDHGRVAGLFLKNQTDALPKLAPSTLDRFEALIVAITQAFPR